MNDKDNKRMVEERQAQQRKKAARQGALMAAEFIHAEDKDIKPIKKEVDDLRIQMDAARQAIMALQQKLGEALRKLAKELEKHIAPELKE